MQLTVKISKFDNLTPPPKKYLRLQTEKWSSPKAYRVRVLFWGGEKLTSKTNPFTSFYKQK